MFNLIKRSVFNNLKHFNKIKNAKLYSNQINISKSAGDYFSMSSKRTLGLWMAGMSGMTVGAVVLGGVTRLTESGLSMTNWHLLKEAPPFSEEAWINEFERYKHYPEYKHILNERGGMSLREFKMIWYMEYAHRMWGRCLGVMFAVPAAVFYYKGYLNGAMKARVLILGGLIASQGLLGWYMVKSGLEEKSENAVPRVSQYRLAAHLGSAIALYSLFMWNAMTFLREPTKIADFPKLKMIRGMTHGVKFMVVLTAISGAFVAGLDAGLIYNSWPKMADKWIPDDISSMIPGWINIFENPTTVQFNHRWMGQLTGTLILGLWLVCQRNKAHLPYKVQLAAHALAVAALGQIMLGISTLVHYVPTSLAISHQSGSLVVLSAALWLSHSLRKMPK